MARMSRAKRRGLGRVAAAVALLAPCALAGCAGDDDAAGAQSRVECVRVELASALLQSDPACTVAGHPLAMSKLPDLEFNPAAGLCFVVGPTEITFASDTGERWTALATAYSGIVENPIAGTSIAPLPQPCAADGPLLVFTAATVAELATTGGEPAGELVMRDTGWAEINPATALPGFVSERLVVTGGRGGVFGAATGELLLTGDEFGGVPAAGSLCAPRLAAELRDLFG